MSRVQWIEDELIAEIFEEDAGRRWGCKVGLVELEGFDSEEDEAFCHSFLFSWVC